MYSITEKQIRELSKCGAKTKVILRQWFPEAVKDIGGWYYYSSYLIWFKREGEPTQKGFFRNTYGENWSIPEVSWTKASAEMIIIALAREAEIKGCMIPFEYYSERIGDNYTYLKGFAYNEESNELIRLDSKSVIYNKNGWASKNSLLGYVGEAWYLATKEGESDIYVYLSDFNISSSYGFRGGFFVNNITFSDRVLSIMSRGDEQEIIKPLFLEVLSYKGYTKENVIGIHHSAEYVVSEENFDPCISNWTFLQNAIYSQRPGLGGVTIYKNGVFASKREEVTTDEWF